jgi:hypothetical protein
MRAINGEHRQPVVELQVDHLIVPRCDIGILSEGE